MPGTGLSGGTLFARAANARRWHCPHRLGTKSKSSDTPREGHISRGKALPSTWRGRASSPWNFLKLEIFETSYNQKLHGDQTKWEETFYRDDRGHLCATNAGAQPVCISKLVVDGHAYGTWSSSIVSQKSSFFGHHCPKCWKMCLSQSISRSPSTFLSKATSSMNLIVR